MTDIDYLKIAEQYAKENPDILGTSNVGCIIVKNGEIISRGSRKTMIIVNDPYIDVTYHAEHIALLIAGEKAKEATLYTTLEPCTKRCCSPGDIQTSCCDLIISAGIKNVTFINHDERFGGGGKEYLKSKGVNVQCYV